MTVSSATFKEILNKFNTYVKEGYFSKISYDIWRNIHKYFQNTDSNYFIFELNNDIAKIIPKDKSKDIFYFSTAKEEDQSFAHFLYSEIYQKGEAMDTTTYINENITNSTYTTTTTPTYVYTTQPSTTTTWATTISPNIEDVEGIEITKDGIFINGKKVLTEEPMDTKNFGINFDFGPVTDNALAVCPFGIAAKNLDGGYIYYDPVACEMKDCTPFTFDTKKFLYKMPVAVSAIAEGDVIMHRGYPMFVKGIEDDQGRVVVIDIAEGEERYILPTKNMFGFNFVTKIVSFLDMKNTGASVENPFGSMLPLLMLLDKKDNKDLDPLMLMALTGALPVSGATGTSNTLQNNPLMMYALLGKSTTQDILPFLMMTSLTPQRN